MAVLDWIGHVQEEDENVADIPAKLTPDEVQEDQEQAVCPEIEEILPDSPGWKFLAPNFCKIKKLIILDLNGLFVKRDVSKRNLETGEIIYPPPPASNRVKLKRTGDRQWMYYRRDVQQFVWDLRQIADVMIWSTCNDKNIQQIIQTCWPDLWKDRYYYFRALFSQQQCEKWSYFEEIPQTPIDLRDKPVFFKPLYHVWRRFREYDEAWTLLVDDTRYKNMRNNWDNCICPPTFDPMNEEQDPDYLTRTLLPWLCRCVLTPNALDYTKANPINNPSDELSRAVFSHFVLENDDN